MLTVIAICLGACVGALSRWQLGLWLNPASVSAGLLPWGTLAANLIGGTGHRLLRRTDHFLQLLGRGGGPAATRPLCAGGRYSQLALVWLPGTHGAGAQNRGSTLGALIERVAHLQR